ncbi:adenosylmethionine decarboxylase [Algihabitans albus]|uniref:adenosylmethionine decarboxylase n=1 Tax=Algihabitans albus TaxID=2164067 RepID=UPI0035D00734
MSRDAALFQLGMDLDRGSSTTQEEVSVSAAGSEAVAGQPDERKDHFILRDGKEYAGTHLIVDLWGAKRIDELDHVEAVLKRCVEAAGATLLHIHLHHFTPNDGISGVAVLAESHISIHSWPEREYAALDVFMCGDAQPHEAVEVLREGFAPSYVAVTEHLRGQGL